MLPKNSVRVLLFCLGLVSPGTVVQASEEHVVIILEDAYFPQKTVVKQGDIVRFVNESGQAHTVFHEDGLWATHPIAQGAELLVTIEPEMTGGFYGMSAKKITGQFDLDTSHVAD